MTTSNLLHLPLPCLPHSSLSLSLTLCSIASAAHPRLRLATRHSQPLLVLLSTLATRYQMLFISFSRFRRRRRQRRRQRRRRRVLLSPPLLVLFLMHILHAVPHNEDLPHAFCFSLSLPAQLVPHFTSDADCVQMIAKYGNNLYAVLPPATPTCPPPPKGWPHLSIQQFVICPYMVYSSSS